MPEKSQEYKKLMKEIEQKKKMLPLQYVCEDTAKEIEDDLEKEAELAEEIGSLPDPYRFAGYDPNVIDFIRRCDTEDQALEIISFLKKKGEITEEQVDQLKNQLQKDGLRSFGEKKERGFYFQQVE